jgi:hypothetical protein
MNKEQIDEMAKIIDDNHGFLVSSVETAKSLYNAGYQKQEWISVEERLPNKDELVLCIGAKGGMFLGDRLSLNWDGKSAYTHVPNSNSGRHALYWMPLPQPPQLKGAE